MSHRFPWSCRVSGMLWSALLAVGLAVIAGCGGGDSQPSGNPNSSSNSPSNSAPATTQGGAKRIIFLTNGNSPFWDACRSGLQEGEKTLLSGTGMSAVMEVNDGTAQGQIEKLRQYGSQPDIVAVAVSVIQADNVAIAEEMRNLQKKGVKIITVDGDVNRNTFRDARPYYIGTDNIVGGRVLGTAAKQLLTARKVEAGGYVQFAGFTDNDNARHRMNGFKESVGEAYAEKDRMPDEMDQTRARDNVRNALTNHADLVSLVGIWSYNAPAIAEVVTERKVRDKITVVTFDAEPGAITHMSDGKIDAMVVQNPFDMGLQTVRLMKAMIQDDAAVIKEMFPNAGEPDGDVYTTGLRVVVPDDGKLLAAEMFDKKTVEFMTLSEFKAWLEKYKLTGS